MMSAFAYKAPHSLQNAVSDLDAEWGVTDILAGGTDLLALMKEGIETPKTVVSLKKIPGLAEIKVTDTGVEIGALATLDQIATHAGIAKHLPALSAAAEVIGGPQIRNMGTLGGNLCQRNRDWYFRNQLDPEVKAETQYAAIFSDQATYVHPSTLAPPLIAYGATVEIAGPKGNKTLPVEKLFQVAVGGKRETVLAPNEIVTKVTIPVKAGVQSADYEVRERDSHDWPLVQASVALTSNGGKVTSASILLGHVGPLPVRATAAEKSLIGKAVTAETAAAAAKAAVAGAKPLEKNAYKVTLAEVAVKRALLAAVGNAYWRNGA
ncbi:MAG: xanthine dehydrogenase family protein subunit M [Planctomycetota bacterium]